MAESEKPRITAARLRIVSSADQPKLEPSQLTESPARYAKRRRFRRLDEAWAELLLADPRMPAHVRLIVVLLAEADFHRHIVITDAIAKAAGLSKWQTYRALEKIRRQGFISLERPGHGKDPIATPLRLARRLHTGVKL